jgi:hypothetical protein
MYLDRIVSVERLQVTLGNTDKEEYQPVGNYGAIKINIQPASAELTAISNGAYGQTYVSFVSVSGIKLADRLTLSGTGTKYIVKGVQDNFWGPLPHLELVLFKGDN